MLDALHQDDAAARGAGTQLDKKIQQEALQRLEFCRRQKVQFELDLREGYFFAAPHRARNVLSSVPTPEVKPRDAQELNSSFAFELCGDFPTVIMNTFMPEAAPWAARKAGVLVPDQAKTQVNADAEKADKLIFEAISASNFYEASGTAFEPDLALGTAALWIERKTAASPVVCQAIPIRELEINVGPDGCVDDRFVVRWAHHRHIPAMLKGITIPDKLKRKFEKDPMGRSAVAWGFWRDWEEAPEVVWHHVVMADNVMLKHITLRGEGSCPLIVGRINPSPEWSWGVGPLIKALPDLRVIDALTDGLLENVELNIRPPVTYPDDSFVNIEEGIEPGMAYPLRPGSEDAVKKIYDPTPPDAAIYNSQDREQRLRRLFYLDWPQQRGDTPPTATQWLDEMIKAQQRIGTPGRVFWREYCAGAFLRFAHILEKDGVIKPVQLDGKHASLQAINPAQLAQEQQDVAQFARFIQIAGAAFPEEFKVWSDGKKTIENLAKKMGADKVWEERSQDQVQTAVANIQKLQAGTAPTAPAVPNSPAGAPVPPDLAGQGPAPINFQERGKEV